MKRTGKSGNLKETKIGKETCWKAVTVIKNLETSKKKGLFPTRFSTV